MTIIPLRDLSPDGDVKGGSPRTPSGGIPAREYQEYIAPVMNGNGVWKAIATGLGGLVAGLLLAWFTAFQGKGVTRFELQEYVDKYSPYSQQRDAITQHFSALDTSIGSIQGKQDRSFERLNHAENEIDKCNLTIERLSNDVKNKMGIAADLLEQKAKK